MTQPIEPAPSAAPAPPASPEPPAIRQPPPPPLPLSTVEFVALLALLTCLTALSIDIMLPVLPELAADLGVTHDNDRQWVITSYLIGLVAGQLFVGPLSDRYGRLPVLFAGLGLFIAGAAAAAAASTFETLLLARTLQGIGGAAPRIIATAIVRDIHHGRQMARIMSLIMTTFIMVPVFAPSLGQLLALAGSWRTPIYLLAVAGVLAALWACRRLAETSPRHARQAEPGPVLPVIPVWQAVATVLGSPTTLAYVATSGFMFGCLMAYIMSSQQIFVDVYGLGALFPAAFGSIAVAMALAGIVNARIVVRLGMRHVSHRALAAFAAISALLLVISVATAGKPPLIVLWAGLSLQFFCFGLIVSNFNAIAIEPLGRVAGTASSAIGSYTTLSGALLGALVGQAFDQTALPLNTAFLVFSLAALAIIVWRERRIGFGREPTA